MKQSFEQWMEQVDTWCWSLFSISIHDLSDCHFADWYEGNVKPKTAAKRAAKASGWR